MPGSKLVAITLRNDAGVEFNAILPVDDAERLAEDLQLQVHIAGSNPKT